MRATRHPGLGAVAALWIAQAFVPAPALAAWEPTRPVEFIIPAGTGGGADQMARTIQGIVTKYNLMKQPMVVINKAGGAGGEGFLDVKASRGNPHKIIITLSNLFTTPLATGIPFNWKDLTPVAMLALDEFILWVNAEKPYKTAKEYIDAAKAANGTFKMAGTGSKQEDQIITEAIQKVAGSSSSSFRNAAAARWRCNWSATTSIDRQQSDRSGGAMARRAAASALCVRQQAGRLQRQDRRRAVVEQHPDLQVAGAGHRVSHAARYLHDPRRDPGPG